MLLTCGNVLGTYAAAMPLRSASGASTSQVSGSCSSMPGTVDEALAKMRGLDGSHWVPCGVCREQERLGWADIFRMHGFVLIKLRNRDPAAPYKFMRLDWGHDGFFFQTAADDNEFQSYCGSQDQGLPDLARSLLLTFMPRQRVYEEVEPTASMKKLVKAINSVKDTPYDLATWNCNHFANLIVEILKYGTGGPLGHKSSVEKLQWWQKESDTHESDTKRTPWSYKPRLLCESFPE